MGRADLASKAFINNPEYFTDFINGVVYNGEEVLTPKSSLQVKELDTVSIYEGDSSLKQRQRDILKDVVYCEYENTIYAMIGIENQMPIDKFMALRNMVYDALRYDLQLRENYASNSKNSSYASLRGHLKPIITFTLCWNTKEWNTPKTTLELFDKIYPGFAKSSLSKYYQSYDLNLVHPIHFDESDLKRFKHLDKIFCYLAFSDDRDKLANWLSNNNSIVRADWISVVEDFLGKPLKKKETEGGIDMCEVFRDMYREMEEKDNLIEEKDNLIEEKDNLIEEKDNLIEEKDNIIEEKDKEIQDLKAQLALLKAQSKYNTEETNLF